MAISINKFSSINNRFKYTIIYIKKHKRILVYYLFYLLPPLASCDTLYTCISSSVDSVPIRILSTHNETWVISSVDIILKPWHH